MAKRFTFLAEGRRLKAVKLVLLAGVALATPLPAIADDAQDDSQALTVETNSALMQAGQQANDALEQLMSARGAVAAAVPAVPSDISLANVPTDLKQPLNLTWNGPAEALAKKIALAVGYGFVVSGKKPASRPVVTMVFRGEPAIWALQRLGIRIRDVAQINVDANAHEIIYRYDVAAQGLSGGISGGLPQ